MRNQTLLNNYALKDYQAKFFAGEWQETFAAKHKRRLGKLYERTTRLLRDEIIFNDALDMEACEVPHSLSRYKWHSFPEHDPEWAYMLNRHGFLVDLAKMYRLTGETQYVVKWKELLLDFIDESNPENKEHCVAWRVIDVGIRLTNWMKSFTYLDLEAILTSQECIRISNAIHQHMAYIRHHYITKYDLSNWGVLAVSGIACVALLCPELVDGETASWSKEKLTLQLSLQFYRDGIHWEQSPLYHHEVLASFAYLLQLSEYLGHSVTWRTQLSQIASASYYYADQKDVLNALHDSDSVSFETVYDVYRYLGLLQDRHPQSDFARLWVGAKYVIDEKGWQLLPSLFVGESSGFYSWKDMKFYACWFNGLHGSSHGHAAQGHFTLSVAGEPFLISTGRYTYMENSLRLMLKSEGAHNALHVREHPATEISGTWSYHRLAQPLGHRVQIFEKGWLASMQWQGEYQDGGVYVIEREIIFLEHLNAFVLFDVYRGRANVELELHYNLAPNVSISKQMPYVVCLRQAEQQLTVWLNPRFVNIEDSCCSLIYNQSSRHQRLVNRCKANNVTEVFVTVIAEGETCSINALEAYQAEEKAPCSTIQGVRIMADNQTYCDVYYNSTDIVSGNKLCYSSLGQPFYGKLNLFSENGQRIHLK